MNGFRQFGKIRYGKIWYNKTMRTLNVQQETGAPELMIRISVRELVEFLLRSGDIDSGMPTGSDTEAMLAGTRIHKKIQRSQKSGYESEVPLLFVHTYQKFTLRLEGRADGLIRENENKEVIPVIDEIKGMYLDVEQMEEPLAVHLAQAKCYAAIYLLGDPEGEPDEIGVQMTYANLDTEEIHRFFYSYSREEILDWFEALLKEFGRWADWLASHNRKRALSMESLAFPFSYREGQKRLVAAVWHAIEAEEDLFLMAPTGVGKTMACLYPAVRAVGSGKADRIFYLTAKNETRRVGSEAFRILRDKGLSMNGVMLTAKEKICPFSEPKCTPDACPYAKGHFDRVNEALFACITEEKLFDGELLQEKAGQYQVCPYELGLDLSSWSDFILGDYNYAFDPDASLRRFFGEGQRGDYVLLVDEAHNLVERGRDMYSAVLVKEHILSAKRAAKEADRRLVKRMDALNKKMLDLKHGCEKRRVYKESEVLPILFEAQKLEEALIGFFQDSKDSALKEKLLDFYFEVRSFANTSLVLDEHYLIFADYEREEKEEGEGEFRLHLRCMNPAKRLTECADKCKSTVFFSATLLPIRYYKKLMTTHEECGALYIPSPFDTGKRLLLIGGDVDTRYRARTPEMYERVADYIRDTALAKTGNYLAFFPSYKMMRDTFRVFREKYGNSDIDWVMQSPYMGEDDREIFLENFYENPERSLVGFCVMGGMFAEGLDLAGEKLIGAVVVGCGLPQVSGETELMKEYYDAQGESGFDFAYRFPGMNKVQQSAGRVIRTQEDRGVVILLDQRFLERGYQKLFPAEWRNFVACDLQQTPGLLKQFWENVPDSGQESKH